MRRKEKTESLEIMATEIFERIERAKDVFKKFDWHGNNRDFEFFQFKTEIDGIWADIKTYTGECLEEHMLFNMHKMKVASIKARQVERDAARSL